MSRSNKHFSIRRKFILISFSIILFFSVAVAVLLIKTQQKDLHQSLERKGRTMGLYIAGICKDALLLKDVMQLDTLVNESHHDSEILYTVIEDANGATLTTPIASLNQQHPLITKLLDKSPPDTPLTTTLATLRKTNKVLELTQKVMVDASSQGTVRIGLSEQNIHHQLNKAIGVIITSMTIISLALAIALHIGTNRLILKPITRICSATEEIAAGNLTVAIPVTTNDEIGILTQSLNTMTANLNRMVSGVGGITNSLNTITDVLAATALNVNDTATTQATEVSGAHQSIQDINSLIDNIITSIEHLALSTAASRSSTIELIASIGEVANNSETLSTSVSGVSSSITEIIASVHEVNRGVDTLNLTASGTATSATQLAASIAEVEASVRQIATVSETVQQDAHNGQNAVKASLQGIMKIKSSSDITFDVISTLSDRVANIGNILSVIEEVTEQTELLALNAAIIAAQAGDHGKGFAVVADEIKELAERTNASTREISQVITGVQDETTRAVEAIKQAENAIDEGILLANQSGSALEQIYNGVEETVDQMREITKVTTEQAAASQAISSAMAGVSQLVQQIARATEEQSNGGQLILASTEEMNSLTENVLLSTREQHAGGKHIADAVETIAQQMQAITEDCAKEQNSNAKVIHAMEAIRQTSAANLAASQQLNDAVSKMQTQLTELRTQIGSFTI